MGLASTIVAVVAVLAGSLAGSAGTYLVGRLSDNDRFARELRIRWDQRRLDAYVAYMTSAKTTGARANRIHEQRLGRSFEAEAGSLVEDLVRSDLRRSEAFESLVLLADGETIEAAHALNHAVWGLEHPARLGKELDESEWHRLADTWITAMNNFHAAARTDLKVFGTFARRDVAALSVSRPERGQAVQLDTRTI